MEFNVENYAFFHQPIEKGLNSTLPVSKLYYWSMENIIPELDDAILVCSIPLIDSNGNVFGVCGFEISELNFKTNYFSSNSEYGDITYIFGAMDINGLDTNNALISGKPAEVSGIHSGGRFIVSEIKGLDLFNQENGKAYYGLYNEIRLYPSDSPFAEQKYVLSILIPKDTVDAKVLRGYLQLIAVCAVFLSIGIFASMFFGKRYINPIMSAFDAIQSGNLEGVRTNISEIDKLIEQIKNLRSANRPLPDDFFEDFTKRVGTLTPVETNIFRYHTENVNEKEIMSKMFITKNAFRKHNERIYDKLGVSGNQALMLYVELIKMSGQTDKIV
jgi:DNA-binding CsgD family transcriptional regulator